MAAMKIYRLEHNESKCGIWYHYKRSPDDDFDICNNLMYQKIERRCEGDEFLGTYSDFDYDNFRKVVDNEWKHACYSPLHFYAWFKFDWIHLIDYGFRLYEIEIDQSNVIVGQTQVIFNPGKVIVKREMSIEEYDNATVCIQCLGD